MGNGPHINVSKNILLVEKQTRFQNMKNKKKIL